jgi:murein L,D-transpeptidase YcbB/YkuD
MKYLFILSSVLLSRLIACENFTGALKSTGSDSAKAENIFTRDMTITSDNSYSDLFLDSTSLENFISSQKLTDSLATGLRNFYNVRNYQFAWFNSDGLTEQGKGFWSLYDYNNDHGDSVKENKLLIARMDTLTQEDTLVITNGDSSFINTELSLTKEFLEYNNTFKEQVGFADPYHVVPVKKMDVLQLTDSILNQKTDSVNQSKRPYNLLKEQLRTYNTIAKNGDWATIPAEAKNFKKGSSSPVIKAIKKRLLLTGELSGSDTSQLFTDSLQSAIIAYKLCHGFDSSASITDSLIADMNIPVAQRIEQILVNMNRMMWVPDISSQQVIEVNIPEFMLNVYDGTTKALKMKVVVGKEGAGTTMFSGDLNQVVFSPYWNIPASIVEEEILPAMKTNPDYLQKNHMEIVKKNDSLPVIRQAPGPDNPLGKVKFLFPNSYDIYFHDTPAKGLFEKNKRAYSHGCIRLEDAKALAVFLLKDDAAWTPEKIEEAMNIGKEQFVKVKNPVPVVVTYFTAWVDENGHLNFRDDVYHHDIKTKEKMFGTTVAMRQTPQIDSVSRETTKRKI